MIKNFLSISTPNSQQNLDMNAVNVPVMLESHQFLQSSEVSIFRNLSILFIYMNY